MSEPSGQACALRGRFLTASPSGTSSPTQPPQYNQHIQQQHLRLNNSNLTRYEAIHVSQRLASSLPTLRVLGPIVFVWYTMYFPFFSLSARKATISQPRGAHGQPTLLGPLHAPGAQPEFPSEVASVDLGPRSFLTYVWFACLNDSPLLRLIG